MVFFRATLCLSALDKVLLQQATSSADDSFFILLYLGKNSSIPCIVGNSHSLVHNSEFVHLLWLLLTHQKLPENLLPMWICNCLLWGTYELLHFLKHMAFFGFSFRPEIPSFFMFSTWFLKDFPPMISSRYTTQVSEVNSFSIVAMNRSNVVACALQCPSGLIVNCHKQ